MGGWVMVHAMAFLNMPPCFVSFGIIMWETLAWSEPYPDMSSNDVMSGIASGTLRPQQPAVCPQQIFALLEEAWAEDGCTHISCFHDTKFHLKIHCQFFFISFSILK